MHIQLHMYNYSGSGRAQAHCVPVLVLVVGTGVALVVHWSPAVEGGVTLNMAHQTGITCRVRGIRIVKHGEGPDAVNRA